MYDNEYILEQYDVYEYLLYITSKKTERRTKRKHQALNLGVFKISR
jgi:hypothetical protein